ANTRIFIRGTNTGGKVDPAPQLFVTKPDRFAALEAAGVKLRNIFSMRRVYMPYVGPAMRLYRTSDQTERDFYWQEDENLPRVDIQAWALSNTVKIAEIYDESPSGNHLGKVFTSYGTPADYPTLTLSNAAGFPEVTWPNGKRMEFHTPTFGQTEQTFFGLIDNQGGQPYQFIRQDIYNGPMQVGPGYYNVNTGSSTELKASASGRHYTAATFKANTANGIKLYVDDVVVAQEDAPAYTFNPAFQNSEAQMGYFRFSPGAWSGAWQEVMLFDTALDASVIAGFRADAEAYYAVPLPPLPAIPDAPPETAYAAPTGFATLINYKGFNFPGAEFSLGNKEAKLGYDYFYPNPSTFPYWRNKGFGLMRLPFDMFRTYRTAHGALDTTELTEMKKVIDAAGALGMRVVLDPHNYGSTAPTNGAIGVDPGATDLFADFWKRMAQKWLNYPNVIFNLMNEPGHQSPAQWKTACQTVITAIRSTGATQLIMIPGAANSTGAHSWVSSGNAAVWAGFNGDPANNFVFDMHNYMDSDFSGTSAVCAVGSGNTLVDATNWARTNGFKIILGEFGYSTDPSCTTEGPAMVAYMKNNADVWLGWTWWAASGFSATYPYFIQPADYSAPVDNPKLAALVAGI
ncbi:MAG: glycoside hydrolase family 5 protein, partial [Janthinobacterium lividum]